MKSENISIIKYLKSLDIKLPLNNTKYVLVGGYPHKNKIDGGKQFCEELIRDFEKPVKILDCIYARPRELWEQVFQKDITFLKTHLPEESFEIKLAVPKNFTEQVKWADTIYLRGGDTGELIKLLSQIPDWIHELNSKTLAGTSAGANVISKYYYDLSGLKLSNGLGILPIKIIVHWKSDYNSPNIDWDKAYSDLENYKENLPILTLKEGEYKVL